MKAADELLFISQLAQRFFRWLHESNEVEDSERPSLENGITRSRAGELFRLFYGKPRRHSKQKKIDSNTNSNRKIKNTEGKVMASLRVQKLMRSKRYDKAIVVCVFCGADGTTFAPIEERQSARAKLKQDRQELRKNKQGIIVSEEPHLELPQSNNNNNIVPINKDIAFSFVVICDPISKAATTLIDVKLSGTHERDFDIPIDEPISLFDDEIYIHGSFKATRIGAYRVTLCFEFEVVEITTHCYKVRILRDVVLRSGDPKLYSVLEPKQPYKKRKKHQDRREQRRIDPKDIFHPPGESKGRRRRGGYKGLYRFHVPKDTRRRVETGEMEDSLVVPWKSEDFQNDDDENSDNEFESESEFGSIYSSFWQNLLWASELQAHEDIRLFDLENVALERRGRLLKLHVSGLAEGRPSVLKGDTVRCRWKSKEYRGRVVVVEQLDVLLEFHRSFHHTFQTNLDRLDTVRFTFPRTNFRTAHAGVLAAPLSMKTSMLVPSKTDALAVSDESTTPATTTARQCPSRFTWTSSQLNEEQKHAVREIVEGRCRPLPYIIFGPPGTGKTTTLVEAIYQLATLRNHSLKILVVAPSNDATDILVEKLSQYFPPSEMVRVLAYTRSIHQVPEAVREYCTDGLDAQQVTQKILGVQITVATISMASRLWCTRGMALSKGHFDVLCVDEAGHATEPEIIAVASTIMDFYKSTINTKKKNKKNEMGGQLVLAGDPMQLGPIVTSELCKTLQMDRSYLERLIQTSPAYSLKHNSNTYPPHLVTFLVNNYRSHPDILKLPNEMFYRNQLIARGDVFQTHSMTKWEHLPTKGFPIVFHAVDGENTREGRSPSWFNPQEAMVVVQYVQKLVKESKPKIAAEDIGIITPYARQVQKIRMALEVSNIDGVKVGSVETFQGQERRVIIISTVRSENSLLQHDLRYNLGFVANEKRFNVAVTRAKSLLIVVGSPRVLETDERNWLPLLRFCKSKNSWMGEEWNEESSSDSDDDEFVQVEIETEEEVNKDEWAAAAQESYCFVNREE